MKKILFLALTAASFACASCENGSSKLEGTSDGSMNDGTVDAGIRRQDTARASSGTIADTTQRTTPGTAAPATTTGR